MAGLTWASVETPVNVAQTDKILTLKATGVQQEKRHCSHSQGGNSYLGLNLLIMFMEVVRLPRRKPGAPYITEPPSIVTLFHS
jgi:hypothetical protein